MRSIVHSAQRQTVVESFVDRPAGRSERMASQQEILARGAGDIGNSRPATGESGEGNGSPLQGSCPEDPMDRGAWQATVHEVAKGWTRLNRLSMEVCTMQDRHINMISNL